MKKDQDKMTMKDKRKYIRKIAAMSAIQSFDGAKEPR